MNRRWATLTNLDSIGVPSSSRLEGKYKAILVSWFLGMGSLVSWNWILTIGYYYYNLFLALVTSGGSSSWRAPAAGCARSARMSSCHHEQAQQLQRTRDGIGREEDEFQILFYFFFGLMIE